MDTVIETVDAVHQPETYSHGSPCIVLPLTFNVRSAFNSEWWFSLARLPLIDVKRLSERPLSDLYDAEGPIKLKNTLRIAANTILGRDHWNASNLALLKLNMPEDLRLLMHLLYLADDANGGGRRLLWSKLDILIRRVNRWIIDEGFNIALKKNTTNRHSD